MNTIDFFKVKENKKGKFSSDILNFLAVKSKGNIAGYIGLF